MNHIVSISIVLYCIVLVGYANGHAKLVVPLGWNPDPSTTGPCGGAAPVTTARATWIAGQQASIQWTVVAGDGEGPVYAYLDTAGGDFTIAGAVYTTLSPGTVTTNSVSAYTITFTAPNVVCTGTNGLCTIHVITNNNWQACSTVAILPPCSNCTVPPPPPPVCALYSGSTSTFCWNYDKSVLIPSGSTAAQLDTITMTTYYSYLNNSKVFTVGLHNQPCNLAYKTFLCEYNLPPCPGSNGIAVGGACHGDCQTAMTDCGLNQTHVGLYSCATLAKCAYETSAALVTLPTMMLFGLLLALAILL